MLRWSGNRRSFLAIVKIKPQSSPNQIAYTTSMTRTKCGNNASFVVIQTDPNPQRSFRFRHTCTPPSCKKIKVFQRTAIPVQCVLT